MTARAADNGATVAELEAIFGWQAAAWLRSTPARPIERAWLRAPCPSSLERLANKLFPHLVERCGIQREKKEDIRCLGIGWWAHKDSNLDPPIKESLAEFETTTLFSQPGQKRGQLHQWVIPDFPTIQRTEKGPVRTAPSPTACQ